MLTSSAELSHCEQRAQSLFTNQLSSAPGLRESFLCAWSVTPMLGGGEGNVPLLYFISPTSILLCQSHLLLFVFLQTAMLPVVAMAADQAVVVW